MAECDRVDDPRLTREAELLEPAHVVGIGRRGQPWDRVLLLARHMQDGAAGHDRLDVRRGAEQIGDDRSGRDDLLEIIEDEQKSFVAQPVGERLGDRSRAPLGDADGRGDPRRDQHRVTDGLERDEEDAVGEVVRSAGRQLQRQARLPGPARAGEGEQPGRGEQSGRLGELGVAADEGGQLGGEVVGSRVERPQRRELGRQAIAEDLDDADRRAQVLEPVLAEVDQPDAVDRMIDQQVTGHRGGEDLTAVGDRRDPRRAVDAESDQALPGLLGSTRMETHPDADRCVLGPWFREQRPLPGDRCFDRGRGLREDHEERIALGSLFGAVVRRPRLAQKSAVALEKLSVAIAADPALEPGGTLDIGEQEGVRAAQRYRLGHRRCTRRRLSDVALRSGRAAARRGRGGSTATAAARPAGWPRSPTTRAPGRSSGRRRRPGRRAGGHRGSTAPRRNRPGRASR